MAVIVVADDDVAIRIMLCELLEAMGHSVLEAADGEACFKHFKAARPDLVITDIFMPGKEGLETIFQLRDLWPGIRILAISVAPNFLEHAKIIGADRVLAKPFSVQQILAIVNELLGAKAVSPPNG